jgi:hypothetical protein
MAGRASSTSRLEQTGKGIRRKRPLSVVVRCVVKQQMLREGLGDDVTQNQTFAQANDLPKNAADGIG